MVPWWVGALVLVYLAASLVVLPALVVMMPADHFVRDEPPRRSWRGRHPVVRVIARVVKNAVGAGLLVAGGIMLVTPGPGLMTMLVGLALLDMPGKRGLERRLVASPPVRHAIDSLRRRAGRPPLRLPPD